MQLSLHQSLKNVYTPYRIIDIFRNKKKKKTKRTEKKNNENES